MNNQKIIHLAKYFPPHKGGIEKITSTFSQDNKVFNIKIIAFSNKKTSKIRKKNLNIITCKTLFESFSQPFSFKYIYHAIKGILFSKVIHVHAPNILAFMILLLPFRKKIIIHWHSDIIHYHNLRFIIYPIEKIILNKATKIVCATENYYQSSKILSNYQNKMVIIPYGVKKEKIVLSKISKKIKTLIYELKEKKILISVGRLVKYKGYEKLIDVARFVNEDSIILIIGNGPLQKSLNKTINTNKLQKKIKILNNISNVELIYLLKNSSLYCCLSINRQESFGITLIEALMNKLPIYSEKIVGSGVERVNLNNITGINIKPLNPQKTALKINELLKNEKKLEAMRNNAYKRYKRLFTADLMLKTFKNLYNEILKN